MSPTQDQIMRAFAALNGFKEVEATILQDVEWAEIDNEFTFLCSLEEFLHTHIKKTTVWVDETGEDFGHSLEELIESHYEFEYQRFERGILGEATE